VFLARLEGLFVLRKKGEGRARGCSLVKARSKSWNNAVERCRLLFLKVYLATRDDLDSGPLYFVVAATYAGHTSVHFELADQLYFKFQYRNEKFVWEE
ncbi:MAG: hypothetical protein ACKO96_31285, partial [Flammeovirgaceae bacterium]